MKTYQKAELIAKNLPTGSYAAGCPTNGQSYGGGLYYRPDGTVIQGRSWVCKDCEVSQ